MLDTNVLIYLYSLDEENKRQAALDAVARNKCYTSTQALNEFCNVCKKTLRLSAESVQVALTEIATPCAVSAVDMEIINKALDLHQKCGYSYYDCLILSSAIACDCCQVFTEDMADGQSIDEAEDAT